MKAKLKNYIIATLILGLVLASSFYSKYIFQAIQKNPEHSLLLVFFLIAMLFVLSTLVSHVSRLTKIPSFVVAIFFGMGAKPLLELVVEHKEPLSVLVGLGAAFILFSGGLETPFVNFKRLVAKILSLSFVGLFLTAFLTSTAIFYLGQFAGFHISVTASVLLGSVLASTDPAAIIPILRRLKFKNRSIKDIVVSESAFTDVTGTLLTLVFLSLIAKGIFFENISTWYASVFSKTSAIIIFKQLFFGILLGIMGYILLESLVNFKKKTHYSHEADLPFFLFVPIMVFVFALVFEGSGYLAAFIAGLLFNLSKHLKDTENFFNNLVEGFFKPTIFILLGALVNIKALILYAPIGVLVALVFMFLIRPVSVFISLSIFRYLGKEKINIRDMMFISCVRETGAIPAVLLVTIASLTIPNTNGLIEIGMWTILGTLIVEPPLTPLIAKKLKIAQEIKDDDLINLPDQPSVMLVSRGYGFIKRLDEVCKYASKNNVNRVVLLLCLEQKYSKELERSVHLAALEAFAKENEKLVEQEKEEIEFEFISRKGLLQDNISFIAEQTNNNVTTIFTGKKLLDYHLEEIKQFSVPIRFID